MPLFLFYNLKSKGSILVLTQKGLESRLHHKVCAKLVWMNKKSLVFHWVLGINYAKQQLQHN